jgi:hypothetical protein
LMPTRPSASVKVVSPLAGIGSPLVIDGRARA